VSPSRTVVRCPWGESPEIYRAYHDTEWGVPLRDDRRLFEFLVLETFQSGLSWLTILKKRGGFRRALLDFDPERLARMTPARVEKVLQDPGIVRNRAKVEATIANARAYLGVLESVGSFSDYSWSFVDGRPVQNRWRSLSELPAKTPMTEAWSKDLKRRGFRFVGPTVAYAHAQATGMVNDHLVGCFRHRECAALGR